MSRMADQEGWAYVEEDALRLPRSAAWNRYWRDHMDSSGRPLIDGFDPLVDVPTMVDSIGWIEVLENDYLYRVVGTTIRDQFGMEITGKRLSELQLGGFEREIRRAFDGIRSDLNPRHMRGYYVRNGRRETGWEASLLPITDTDGALTRILLGMAYSKRF